MDKTSEISNPVSDSGTVNMVDGSNDKDNILYDIVHRQPLITLINNYYWKWDPLVVTIRNVIFQYYLFSFISTDNLSHVVYNIGQIIN